MPYENNRKVEVFVDGGWHEISMLDLKPGDRFRMFDPDGAPVKLMGSDETEFVAESEPFVDEGTGVHAVRIQSQTFVHVP